MIEKILKNPITSSVKESIEKTTKKIAIAVPFISSFARSILQDDLLLRIKDKRLITRFDEASIHTFDLPTLKYLLSIGFKIHYDNSIHLKLYLFDNEALVTSSNLTQAGFEDNVELTVKVDSTNVTECQTIFNELWSLSSSSNVTNQLIEINWAKYEIIKKRESLRKKAKAFNTSYVPKKIGPLDVQLLLNEVMEQKTDFSDRLLISTEANKRRERVKENLRKGFDSTLFYLDKKNRNSKASLFYEFAHGQESKLAGTGLWDHQFKAVSEHRDFKSVVEFMFPEMTGGAKLNLEDGDTFKEFCNGIFDFEIPYFSDVLPVRLASYFYPAYILPIFRLSDLEKICSLLGLKTEAETRGDRLSTYNEFLKGKMKVSPYDNNVKYQFAYQVWYAADVYSRLLKRENFEAIVLSYKNEWEKEFANQGKKFLINLKVIPANS